MGPCSSFSLPNRLIWLDGVQAKSSSSTPNSKNFVCMDHGGSVMSKQEKDLPQTVGDTCCLTCHHMLLQQDFSRSLIQRGPNQEKQYTKVCVQGCPHTFGHIRVVYFGWTVMSFFSVVFDDDKTDDRHNNLTSRSIDTTCHGRKHMYMLKFLWDTLSHFFVKCCSRGQKMNFQTQKHWKKPDNVIRYDWKLPSSYRMGLEVSVCFSPVFYYSSYYYIRHICDKPVLVNIWPSDLWSFWL